MRKENRKKKSIQDIDGLLPRTISPDRRNLKKMNDKTPREIHSTRNGNASTHKLSFDRTGQKLSKEKKNYTLKTHEVTRKIGKFPTEERAWSFGKKRKKALDFVQLDKSTELKWLSTRESVHVYWQIAYKGKIVRKIPEAHRLSFGSQQESRIERIELFHPLSRSPPLAHSFFLSILFLSDVFDCVEVGSWGKHKSLNSSWFLFFLFFLPIYIRTEEIFSFSLCLPVCWRSFRSILSHWLSLSLSQAFSLMSFFRFSFWIFFYIRSAPADPPILALLLPHDSIDSSSCCGLTHSCETRSSLSLSRLEKKLLEIFDWLTPFSLLRLLFASRFSVSTLHRSFVYTFFLCFALPFTSI